MHELMNQVIQTYSAATTIPHILQGLRSRNNRMRTESADHVGVLLDNYGAEDDRERIIVRRFKFEELRIEEIQDHEILVSDFREDLHRRLLSADFKDQVDGIEILQKRGVPNKGSRQESIMSVQDINIQSHVLISLKDSKKDDRERIIVRRFKFEELRIEEIQDLENDVMKYFREDLHRRLLSADFKDQVNGIEMLQKVLEIIPELLDMLRNEGYTMTEVEETIFLPGLVEKV